MTQRSHALLCQLRPGGVTGLVNEKHVRVQLKEGSISFDAIGFGLANKLSLLDNPVDVAIMPRHNPKGDKSPLEIQIKDIRKLVPERDGQTKT